MKESYTGQHLRELLGRRAAGRGKREREAAEWTAVVHNITNMMLDNSVINDGLRNGRLNGVLLEEYRITNLVKKRW